MDTNEHITHLQEQLAVHRRTLAILLRQLANLGANHAPPGIHNGIAEARAAIAQLKAALRAAGVAVEDLAGDDEHAWGKQLLDRLPLDTVPEPAPMPAHSRIELPPNPLFVGREDDFKKLATTLKHGSTTVIAATTGMGGVGKTQLASELAHRYGQFFAGGVYWLSFAEADNIESEIVACGTAMDLPGFAGLEFPDQVARVRQIWQEAVPRLLIFDNCEDEALLHKYRPKTSGSRVLVTSRRQRWDDALGVREHRLGTLPRDESIALLRKFRPDLPKDDADLDALAAALGDLPLALHVAGSYLKRYKQTPAQYLEKLRSAPCSSLRYGRSATRLRTTSAMWP